MQPRSPSTTDDRPAGAAVVVQFPRAFRAQPVAADREQFLLNLRLEASRLGCDLGQRAAISRGAREALNLGISQERVREKALITARAMVRVSFEPVPA